MAGWHNHINPSTSLGWHLFKLFCIGLALFPVYLFEYLIHPLNISAGIINKKFKLGDDPYLVFYTCAKLIPYLGCVCFDGIKCQLSIGIVKKTQEYPRDGQIRCNPNFGDRDKCIW